MLRRPKNPGSRPAERTEAQWKALRIFQLRGLYHNLHTLSSVRMWAVQRLIDDQIAELGGERESVRWDRRRREWETNLLQDNDEAIF